MTNSRPSRHSLPPVLLITFLGFLASPAFAQSQPMVEQRDRETIYRIVQGGPLPNAVDVTVGIAGAWTAQLLPDGPPMLLGPKPAEGVAPGVVKLELSSWAAAAAPGRHEKIAQFTPTSGGAPEQWKVTLEVVARLPGPAFSYLDGPHQCAEAAGLPDAAICQVPNERPTGGFTPPPAGGAYVDPNFGAQVRILSDARSTHGYSSPTAISANNKHVLLFQDTVKVVEFETGKEVRGRTGTPFEGAIWDARDDNLLYFFSGGAIRSYDVERNRIQTVVDYSGGPSRFTRLTNGATGDSSKDNWIPFFDKAQEQACVYSVDDDRTFCARYGDVSRGPHRVDFAQVTKGVDSESGKRYVILAAQPVMMIFSVNEAAGRLDFETFGPESPIGRGDRDGICEEGERCIGALHADTMEDSSGLQHLVFAGETLHACGYSLYSYQLNRGTTMGVPIELGGGMKRVMQLYRCGGVDRWADLHIGCAKAAPYCVVSTTNAGFNRQLPVNQPLQRSAHVSELFVIRDNGAEIRRLAQHRSVPLEGEPANSYWSTPRACISNDGAWILADSNFGEVERQRVIIVETGFGPSKLASESVVNAASLERGIAAGSIATLFGQNLANCRRGAETFPLPESICGTSVEFGGRLGALLYAGPNQVNVVVPTDFTSGGELKVRAEREGRQISLAETVVAEQFVGLYAPAIYTYSLGGGVQRAVLQNGADASLNGPAGSGSGIRPLEPGEFGSLFVNGLGPTDPPTSIRDPAPAQEPLARTVSTVSVFVNGRQQQVLYAGLAPSFSSVFQVNFVLAPETPVLPAGSNQVWLAVEGRESPRLVLSLAGEPAPQPQI